MHLDKSGVLCLKVLLYLCADFVAEVAINGPVTGDHHAPRIREVAAVFVALHRCRALHIKPVALALQVPCIGQIGECKFLKRFLGFGCRLYGFNLSLLFFEVLALRLRQVALVKNLKGFGKWWVRHYSA